MSVGSIASTPGVSPTTSGPAHYGQTVYKDGMNGIANLLGESVQQLQQSMKSGQSLAQVLQAKGFTTQQGAQAFLSGVQSGVSADVASGTISQQQATTILTNQTNKINAFLGTSVSDPGLATSTTSTSGTGSILNASA